MKSQWSPMLEPQLMGMAMVFWAGPALWYYTFFFQQRGLAFFIVLAWGSGLWVLGFSASARMRWEQENPTIQDQLSFFALMGYGMGLVLLWVLRRGKRREIDRSGDQGVGLERGAVLVDPDQWERYPHSHVFVHGVLSIPVVVFGVWLAVTNSSLIGLVMIVAHLLSTAATFAWAAQLQRKYVVEHPGWTNVELNPLEKVGYWIGSVAYDTGMPVIERIRNRNDPDRGAGS